MTFLKSIDILEAVSREEVQNIIITSYDFKATDKTSGGNGVGSKAGKGNQEEHVVLPKRCLFAQQNASAHIFIRESVPSAQNFITNNI